MCPGMRPATGWMAYFTSTPLASSRLGHLLDGVLGLRDGQPVAGHHDDLVGIGHLDRGIGGDGGLDGALIAARGRPRRPRHRRRSRTRWPGWTGSSPRPSGWSGSNPRRPTIMPATIIAVLFSARPAAAADNPVIALSSEMTTGMSAPPIGNTTNRPMIPASDEHQHDQPARAAHPGVQPDVDRGRDRTDQQDRRWRPERPWRTGRAACSTFLGIDSCSFRNATSEPQNDTEPMIAANSEPTTSATVGD